MISGQRLGAWQVVEEIGRGGMGTVYSAVRADRAFEKRVAIKVVKKGVDTDAVLERFGHERRILAGLDHPYIAHLIDGGTSPDGRPWFVMELVEGRPIQEFCREQHLSVRECCGLFRKVCESVSYAHRNLVIHRDLKPANILVTAEGSPKLLDFGIARLLSVEPGERTLAQETAPANALTPAYASPEQQRGEAVNTATDVYSLGAVLYEILAGQTPVARREGANERAIGKPSEAATEKAVREDLAGDLDNIVLKATHPDQARRYRSVDELSEDLNRCLQGLPVTAQEDSFRYRLGKFSGRHRLGVMVSAGLLCALAAGVVAMLWEAHRAELQRQRAEQSLGQMVNMANRTLFDVHGAIERLPGALEARKQLVVETMRYLDQLAKESGDDPRVQLLLAAGYARVAELKGSVPGQPSLGDWPGALAAYRKAAEILDAMLARDPDNEVLLLRRAEVSEGMGGALMVADSAANSAAEFERGSRAASKLLAKEPGDRAARIVAAQLQLNAMGVLSEQDPEAGRQKLLGALAGFERLAADYPDDPDALMPLAQANGFLGVAVALQDRNVENVVYYRRAAELFERMLAIRPRDAVAQRALLMQYSHLTGALQESGTASDQKMAIEYARKDVTIAESLHAADPGNQIATLDLSGAYVRLSSVLPVSRSDEAFQLLDRAFGMIEAVAAKAPQITRLQSALATVDVQRGESMKRLHRNREALFYYRRSLGRLPALAGKSRGDSVDHYRVQVEGEFCGLLASLGERDQAVSAVAQMTGEARQLGPGWPSAVPKALGWAGDAFAELAGQPGDVEESKSDWRSAAKYYADSLEEWGKAPGRVATNSRREIEKERAALARCRFELASR